MCAGTTVQEFKITQNNNMLGETQPFEIYIARLYDFDEQRECKELNNTRILMIRAPVCFFKRRRTLQDSLIYRETCITKSLRFLVFSHSGFILFQEIIFPVSSLNFCKHFDIKFSYFYIKTELYQLIIDEVASQRSQNLRKTIRPDRLI